MSKKQTKPQSQGQSGRELDLGFTDLTKNEQKVVLALFPTDGSSRRPVLTIKELVEACGWKSLAASNSNEEFKGKARGNSRVRNALRRLVRSYWVENHGYRGSGEYRLTKEAVPELREEGHVPDVKVKKSARAKTKPKEEAIAF